MANKVAVITGGANGIGLAYAKALLKTKINKIFILDIDEKKARQETEILNSKYGNNQVEYFQLDVSNLKQFEEVVRAVVKKVPQIDIFINNAGVADPDLAIPVNLIGTLNGTNLAMKYMGKDQGGNGGIVVSTASVCGFKASPLMPSYTASKWGILGLITSLGTPIIRSRTDINFMAICPGPTDTPILQTFIKLAMTPLNEAEIKTTGKIMQSTELIGDALIKVLNENVNGSIWVVENCEEPYRVEFPNYTTLRV